MPFVSGLTVKDIKQTLKKEQCDVRRCSSFAKVSLNDFCDFQDLSYLQWQNISLKNLDYYSIIMQPFVVLAFTYNQTALLSVHVSIFG